MAFAEILRWCAWDRLFNASRPRHRFSITFLFRLSWLFRITLRTVREGDDDSVSSSGMNEPLCIFARVSDNIMMNNGHKWLIRVDIPAFLHRTDSLRGFLVQLKEPLSKAADQNKLDEHFRWVKRWISLFISRYSFADSKYWDCCATTNWERAHGCESQRP